MARICILLRARDKLELSELRSDSVEVRRPVKRHCNSLSKTDRFRLVEVRIGQILVTLVAQSGRVC